VLCPDLVVAVAVAAGVRVEKRHCVFTTVAGGAVTVSPLGKAPTQLNSQLLAAPAELKHMDRLAMGQNNFFIFFDPRGAAPRRRLPLPWLHDVLCCGDVLSVVVVVVAVAAVAAVQRTRS
jgi:hypothetical protein